MTGGRSVLWGAGLVVAIGAGVATAHGLYEVAVAARVPAAIAWLYPLITDGLALAAYATTARLHTGARGYAWTVVVLAAGLSGLAQATYLAGGVAATPAAPTMLRFGVGAWPAIAAAIVAHLLHLLGPAEPATAAPSTVGIGQTDTARPPTTPAASGSHGDPRGRPGADDRGPAATVDETPLPAVPSPVNPHPAAVQPPAASVQPVQLVQPVPPVQPPAVQPGPPGHRDRPVRPSGPGSASDHARRVARAHQARHGVLPTVSELAEASQVARGTAGNVLKALRAERPTLQIIHNGPETNPDR